MTVYYLDTSVAVRIHLRERSAVAWFTEAVGDDGNRVVSSRILQTELTRYLRREDLPVSQRDDVLDYLDLVELDEQVLAQAEAIVPHVKTLDAIHSATAVMCGSEVIVVSHDTTLLRIAAELGLRVLDPIHG